MLIKSRFLVLDEVFLRQNDKDTVLFSFRRLS